MVNECKREDTRKRSRELGTVADEMGRKSYAEKKGLLGFL